MWLATQTTWVEAIQVLVIHGPCNTYSRRKRFCLTRARSLSETSIEERRLVLLLRCTRVLMSSLLGRRLKRPKAPRWVNDPPGMRAVQATTQENGLTVSSHRQSRATRPCPCPVRSQTRCQAQSPHLTSVARSLVDAGPSQGRRAGES